MSSALTSVLVFLVTRAVTCATRCAEHPQCVPRGFVCPLQEMIGSVMERGPQFTEPEYNNLLQLAHRSQRGAREEDMQARLDRLRDVLTELESVV